MTTDSRTPTTGSSEYLCEQCSCDLTLDDRVSGATWRASSDGAIGRLVIPKKDLWYFERFSVSRRTVTNPELPELLDRCRFCAALKRAFLDRYENRGFWSSSVARIPIKIKYWWSDDLEFRVGESEVGLSLSYLIVNAYPPDKSLVTTKYGDSFQFPIAASKGQCRDWLGIKRDREDLLSPMSDGNIRLVRRWLDECMDDGCNQIRNDEHFVPKRLLDLGLSGGEMEPPILIDTIESPPKPTLAENNIRYACLSYCWGSGSLPLRTTSQTLAKHKQSIPVEELPPVFRDAILVARELGLRYLWIDALCIIQDDASDWEEESGRMSDIFRHSFITFGAATSSACDETFLQRPEVDLIDLNFRSSLNPDVSGVYSISLSLRNHLDGWEPDSYKSIWNTRGWVWQEQHMAQRILTFGARMLHFRCHRRVVTDEGHSHDKPMYSSTFQASKLKRWRMWIGEYSGRKFTYACDKLAAISGFAKSLQKLIEREHEAPTYLAGLWLDDKFHENVKWFLVDNHPSFGKMLESLQNDENYCAPSWSWASRDQEVTWLVVPAEEDFELVRHNLIPAKSDTMVKIKPGSSITVRGKILELPHRPSNGAFAPEPRKGEYNERYWELIELGGRIKYFLDWDPHLGYDGDLKGQLHLFITSVTTLPSYDEFARDSGLILYPIRLESGVQFVRVGVFNAYHVSLTSWPIREVTIF